VFFLRRVNPIGLTDHPKWQVTPLRGRSLPLTTRATEVAPHSRPLQITYRFSLSCSSSSSRSYRTSASEQVCVCLFIFCSYALQLKFSERGSVLFPTGGGTHRRRATFERCSVFVGGVRLGGWGVVRVVCVCVGDGGVVLCRCVCVCV